MDTPYAYGPYFAATGGKIMHSEKASKRSAIKLRRYRIFGGIKPSAYKSSSLRSRIMPSPIPDQLFLSLKQHEGPPAKPLVKVGDQVLKYQLIAAAEQNTSVNLHAPTSGKVTAIKRHPIPNLHQQSALCIQLETDKKDRAIWLFSKADYRAMDHLALLKLVKQAGVFGFENAAFYTMEKIGQNNGNRIELLIINATEPEPYITSCEALLREFAIEVVSGAEILQKISLARRCVITIERNKRDAIAAVKNALRNSSISLIEAQDKYPGGGEKQVIQGITGLEVPTEGVPEDLGILVHSASTAFATYKAIVRGEPCISRITTLTGEPLQTPKNFEALIGTPVSYLFSICGIDSERPIDAIMGGSIKGIELQDLSTPILKTSDCVIAKSDIEFPLKDKEKACIRCGFCAEVCPAKLLPQQLYAYTRSHNYQELKSHGLSDCIECGACAYICPSNIPLVQYYRAGKQSLREITESEQQSEYRQSRFQTHQSRLDKIQDNKLSKRRVRRLESEQKLTNIFSREKAKQEIIAAVNRVKARRKNSIIGTKQKDDASNK